MKTLKLQDKINTSSFKFYLSDVSHNNTELDNTASSKSKSKRTSFGKNVVFHLSRKEQAGIWDDSKNKHQENILKGS